MVELELEVKGHVHNYNFNHVSQGWGCACRPIVVFDSQSSHSSVLRLIVCPHEMAVHATCVNNEKANVTSKIPVEPV